MDYEYKNISSDQEARKELVEEHKSTATPTIVWDDEVIVGFDRDRLEELLQN